MGQRCRSCESKRILRGAVVLRGPSAFGLNRGPVLQVAGEQSTMSAQVCVDCGTIELRAVDLGGLRAAYGRMPESLGLTSQY